jgi:hypothetical protein
LSGNSGMARQEKGTPLRITRAMERGREKGWADR